MSGDYQDAGVEPLIEDLLADPIVQLLLERDRIDPAELRRVLASVRERLQDAEATESGRPEAA